MANLIERLNDIFDQSQDQEDALNRIYRLFIPEWDRVIRIKGYPCCGLGLHRYLTHRFIVFDSEHHPEKTFGQLWNCWGFSRDTTLGDFEVSLKPCELEIKSECFV